MDKTQVSLKRQAPQVAPFKIKSGLQAGNGGTASSMGGVVATSDTGPPEGP